MSENTRRREGDPLRWHRVWSIGIHAGASPFELLPMPCNPVLTASDITDADAYYVADPFMIRHDGLWRMVFEVLLRKSRRGVIGLATSQDMQYWNYRGLVLDAPFHLAYPQVFFWEGTICMVPETIEAGAVRLYRATSFDGPFAYAGELIDGIWADPTVFLYDGLWWILACSTPHENRTLQLFFAERLIGPWRRHPRSPVVGDDNRRARPGGRVFRHSGRLFRLAQDCGPRYGARLRAIEITELTPGQYAERVCDLDPLLEPAPAGWNSNGMHHMDPHELEDGTWVACVDGDALHRVDVDGKRI